MRAWGGTFLRPGCPTLGILTGRVAKGPPGAVDQRDGRGAARVLGCGLMDDDFRWLLAREAPRLRRFAIALTGSVDHGDDLLQDALERALRKRRLLAASGSIRSWLFKLLYRIYLNQAKRGRLERHSLASLDRNQTAPPNQEHHVEVLNISVALRALPADQRDAVILVGLEGFSYDEAADICGVPLGTFKSRLFRGREALWKMRHDEPGRRLQRVK